MKALLAMLATVVALASLASGASALESTIIRGVGIGKIKVGMTRAQVERVLGKDSLVNDRERIGTTPYLELGWNFSAWSVGFLKQRGTYRVAQVGTTLRQERTTQGLGVGSPFLAVARAYPQAICGLYYANMGSEQSYARVAGTRSSFYAIVVASERKHLAFLVREVDKWNANGPWVVYEVIVRNSVPGAVDFPLSSRCKIGWRERGTPITVP